ncbi:S-adenosyl-L-methionine-dependent methyltransferase [Linnemannia elongata AG-77]|uniref:S-adenosyl-L-methionine-dependent methyltransferase n=1 Tax=Linnemannia elongata AG-77 TaxID=1314771 RepID=A0A197K0L2_9FUNG|nr:S-adenosyl-L-methionine-dependent methyltransferase [Linnemannia elongata AG-77]
MTTHNYHQPQRQTIEIFLSVPGGLEDVAVRRLPSLLLDSATHIHYQIGSGYLTLRFGAHSSDDSSNNNNGHTGGSGDTVGGEDATESRSSPSSSFKYRRNNTESISKVIADLIEHPPLCIFAAYVSIGEISIPRTLLFDAPPKELLDYCMNGFKSPATPPPATTQHGSSSSLDPQKIGNDEALEATVTNDDDDLGLRWWQGLSVLQFAPSTLSESLASFLLQATPLINSAETHKSSRNANSTEATLPVRYRASFDRGDVQHKGVRSQDLAAALGGLTGDTFPSWKVNLKEFDVEVMGRWIQDELEEVQYKPKLPADRLISVRSEEEEGDTEFSNKRPRTENASQQQGAESGGEFVKMQVGMTLPLALSTCPYRFRPLDGRTSLRIEIAYSLLALADPKPGEVVVDTCSGVGTFPIVGAVHYPESWFIGLEVLPYNVERAAQNAKEMIEKVDRHHEQERAAAECEARTSTGTIVRSYNTRHPSLIVGDAGAVCWRSGAVDLIISDLPWGKRENSHVYNCKLYPRLIREIIRLLRVNGRALLITGERKLLQRQLDAPFARPHLKLLQKREITIGYKVIVFELLRV